MVTQVQVQVQVHENLIAGQHARVRDDFDSSERLLLVDIEILVS